MCDDQYLTDEDNPHHYVMTAMCYEIINGQNFQIQMMRVINEALEYHDAEDDCEVNVSGVLPAPKKTKVPNKSHKKMKKSKAPKIR